MLPNPKRGEVRQVDLDPTVGSEIQKSRPCVVISADGIGRLPLRLVVPLTGWKPAYAGYPWCVQVGPDANNGWSKLLDELQEQTVGAIAKAIAVCVDYEP